MKIVRLDFDKILAAKKREGAGQETSARFPRGGPEAQRKSGPEGGPGITEMALMVVGILYLLLGFILAVVTATVGEGPTAALAAVNVFAASLLAAMLFFAAHWVLKYLRRITEAIERREKQGPTQL